MTVMKGRRNSAHFPLLPSLSSFLFPLIQAKRDARLPSRAAIDLACDSWNAEASLRRHLMRERSILRKAMPMIMMMIEARMEKTPSQICSVLAHRSRTEV